MTSNKYAPPKSHVADLTGEKPSPPLWNPNAAANWSLLFSAAFGAFLHMKNWEALGQLDRAASAKTWFVVSLSVLGCLWCASLIGPYLDLPVAAEKAIGFVLLLAWYFGGARGQAKYVKTHFGNAYPRRRWFEPLAIATLVLFGVGLVLGVLTLVLKSLA